MGYNEIMKKIDALKFACFVLLLVFAAWAVEHYHLYHRLIMLKGWIRMNGPAGIAVFVVFYGLAFSFGVPAIALTVFAGTVFGAMTGFLASSAGATISIMLTFFLSRFLARDLIKDTVGKHRTFIKIDELTERYGWYIVAIVRFLPFIPAEIANYGFGLTKIKFLPYVLCSWLCMLPCIFIYIAGTGAYINYKNDQVIPWLLLIPSAIMLGLLIFAGIRFMKLIEPSLKKKDKD
jgi:uncharacterized membrane protein YdjX (TVP38/TMEM64 family)